MQLERTIFSATPIDPYAVFHDVDLDDLVDALEELAANDAKMSTISADHIAALNTTSIVKYAYLRMLSSRPQLKTPGEKSTSPEPLFSSSTLLAMDKLPA